MELSIFVLCDQWVLVGCGKRQIEGRVRIENASVVRRWGTSHGLGELAEVGPLPNTKLDRTGVVIVERASLRFEIPCKREAWKDY